MDEIAAAIASLAPAKAPGQDGIPLDFYAAYSEVLVPELLKLYNHIFESGSLPESFRQAVIIVLPKPGKNPQYPNSYRPISLLQADIKILAKVLAICLNQIILSIIHHDQTGFMPGKNTTMNLRRLYMNIQATHENIGDRAVVALDAAKAFDSVEWGYLWECLRRFGFGPRFIKWVQLLYFSPEARVLVNGKTSDSFSLELETRQGCPLCPLLYALAVEPLAISLRTHPGVRCLRMGNLVETVSLYADDMLLYLEDTCPSLQAALQTIEDFGKHSGLSMNWSKSQIMPLDLP